MDEAELRHRLRALAEDSPATADIRAALSAGDAVDRNRHRRLPLLVAAAVVLVTGGTIALLGERVNPLQPPGFQPSDPSSVVSTDGPPPRSPTTTPARSLTRSSTPDTSREGSRPAAPSPTQSGSPSRSPSAPGTPDRPATTPPATELEQPPSVGTTREAPSAGSSPPGTTR